MLKNEDSPTGTEAPLPLFDAHGQAALLLVESLIHGLCENATLDTKQAVEIVETAVEVQLDYADAADGDGASMSRSHALLSAIAASLMADDRPQPARPRLV